MYTTKRIDLQFKDDTRNNKGMVFIDSMIVWSDDLNGYIIPQGIKERLKEILEKEVHPPYRADDKRTFHTLTER